ncbi:MAG: DUF3887 domain-containing protein, partial [Pirellulaceae bacterium]
MLSPKILRVLPLLFLGLLIGCGQAQTPEQQSVPSEQQPIQQSPEPETAEAESEVTEDVQPEWIPESAARALLALIIAGQYDQVAENFNDQVAVALPGEKLKTTVETLQKQVGRYQGVADEAKVQEIQSNQVVDLLCSFEITKLVFRVSYNEQQQVAGIFFLPAPAEPTPVDKNAPPDVQLQTKDTTLYGTIELPAGVGPFPVVLIVGGSGPNDRDGNQAA